MSARTLRDPTDAQMAAPERWQVDGLWVETGDAYAWNGLDTDNNPTKSCCGGAQDITVEDIDEDDPHAAIYVTSDQRDNCCGGIWTHAGNLALRTSGFGPKPQVVADAEQLLVELRAETVTYGQIKQRLGDLVRDVRRTLSPSATPKGVCSAHMQDVQFVGSGWSHDDGTPCNTPAIMLAT